MRISTSLSLIAAFASISTTAALAGSQSALDPYATVQPPNHKASSVTRKTKAVSVYDGVATKAQNLGKSSKAAGSALADRAAGAGSKLADTGRTLGGGVAGGTAKMGGGLANGAKASGSFFMKGARVVGRGFKATGAKVADGGQTVIEHVGTWPGNVKHGFVVTGSKIADGTQAVTHGLVSGTEKLKDSTISVGEKVSSMPRAVVHGVKAAPKALTAKSGDSEKTPNAVPSAQPEVAPTQVAETPATESKEPSLMQKSVGLPKAVGHGVMATAGKMGHSVGKLFHREEAKATATAQAPEGQVH